MKFYEKYKKSSVILLLILQYLIEFLIIPWCFCYEDTFNASLLCIIVHFFIAILCVIIVSKNILYWIYADIIYCILIYIYDGKGAYGIGIWLDGKYHKDVCLFHITIWLCYLLIIQLIALIITIIAKKIHSYLKTKRSK